MKKKYFSIAFLLLAISYLNHSFLEQKNTRSAEQAIFKKEHVDKVQMDAHLAFAEYINYE